MNATLFLVVGFALLIGAALGLLGGGGSILTIPLLVYGVGLAEKTAIVMSLVVVGTTSIVAALPHIRRGTVVWPVTLPFAGAGMVGAFLGGQLMRFIPGAVLLAMLALLMFGTAVAMWRGRATATATTTTTTATATATTATATTTAAPKADPKVMVKFLALGLAVGSVTGLLGAGGGFLIVPVLTLLGGLSMRQAIGSSLVVIAANSAAGFTGHVGEVDIDVGLTAIVTVAAVVGSVVGSVVAPRVKPEMLRKGFAVFVAVLAVLMIGRQLFVLMTV